MAGNGQTIPNKGLMPLEMRSEAAGISSKFEVAKISRPLWSIGKISNVGYNVVSASGQGTIYHQGYGKQVGIFLRKGRLYGGDVELRNPAHTTTKAKSGLAIKVNKVFARQE